MSSKVFIRAEPLTAEAFRPFGDIIQMEGHKPQLINRGNTEKFTDLATLTASEDGRFAMHLYRSKPASLPVSIKLLERHPLGSQAFIPLHDRPFPVVVALAGASPDASDLRVFLSNGRQGINLHPGVWHHYQISLDQESEYLVLDRMGSGANMDEVVLEETAQLQF